ncbi:MAG: hypothetical protein P8M78_16450 [Myxococcota bacterium]|nr:hypothetical protein [Myxococcota bacterium]
MKWLAYGHPVFMTGALVLVGVAFKRGLALRKRRLAGLPRERAQRLAHRSVARWGAGLVILGSISGPVSAIYLRGWSPLGTFHGWLGLMAAILFAVTGWWGWQLDQGASRSVSAHGWSALLAVAMAALAAAAGMVLLP